MKIGIRLCILCVLFVACKSSDCEVDEDFFNTYIENKQKIVLSVQKNDKGLSGESLRSIFYFQTLTNLQSRAVFGDLSYYESNNDYKKDIRQWEKWFDKNKCLITADSSNTAMNSVLSSTQWMDN